VQEAVNLRRPRVQEAASRNSRALGRGDQDSKEKGNGEQTPPTLKKSKRHRRESPKVNKNLSCK
jgi:hypothetical protein